MFTFIARINIYSSSRRLTRSLLLPSCVPSNTHSYRKRQNSTVQSQFDHHFVQIHSWKLTHEPHEPTLQWNIRFREEKLIDSEQDKLDENWDSWFENNQLFSSTTFLKDQLYFLANSPVKLMTKRRRALSTSIDIPHKRERYCEHEFNLPRRTWSNTHYEPHLVKSRYHHFNFHIISYNILAQKLIEDNPLLYENCIENNLEWNQRKARLFNEILRQNADIICLQEMQNEHYNRDFRPKLSRHGYDSIYIKRTGDKSDGCCLFYKADRLKLIASKTVPFYRQNIQLLDRDNCGLIALFQPLTSNASSDDLFCVATTHLLFSPKRGDIKLAQIQYFLAEIDRLSLKDRQLNIYYPIIVCGDFNAQPDSPFSSFLLNGHIKYDAYRSIEISGQIPRTLTNNRFSLQLPSSELLPSSFVTSDCRFPRHVNSNNRNHLIFQSYINQQSSAILTHNKKLYSVYDFDQSSYVTTCINKEIGLVDYILYTKHIDDQHRLNLISRYDLYEKDQIFNLNLPNHQFPSDHFLLAAKFALKLRKKKKKD